LRIGQELESRFGERLTNLGGKLGADIVTKAKETPQTRGVAAIDGEKTKTMIAGEEIVAAIAIVLGQVAGKAILHGAEVVDDRFEVDGRLHVLGQGAFANEVNAPFGTQFSKRTVHKLFLKRWRRATNGAPIAQEATQGGGVLAMDGEEAGQTLVVEIGPMAGDVG